MITGTGKCGINALRKLAESNRSSREDSFIDRSRLNELDGMSQTARETRDKLSQTLEMTQKKLERDVKQKYYDSVRASKRLRPPNGARSFDGSRIKLICSLVIVQLLIFLFLYRCVIFLRDCMPFIKIGQIICYSGTRNVPH